MLHFILGTVPANDNDNDLSNGQVVILNFPILTQPVGGVPRKTMVFGYLASITKTYSHGEELLIYVKLQ